MFEFLTRLFQPYKAQPGSVFRLPDWNRKILCNRGVDHWALTDAWFGDSSGKFEPSDGSTNVRVIAFKDGRPAAGALVHLFSPSWDITEVTKMDAVSGNAMATFVLGPGENFDPNKGERGYDSVKMDGESDIVDGIGLPLKQHVQTWLVYEHRKGNGLPAPEPTPDPQPSGDGISREQWNAWFDKIRAE